MFEPFPAVVAFVPLIGYLLVLALIRFSGSVRVISGGADIAALSFALSGLIIIGPMELFFPKATASLLGAWIWLPLILLYVLVACLWMIGSRPRLVVYGRSADEVFPLLVRVCHRIDDRCVHDNDQGQIHLPTVGAHLRLDSTPGHDCVSIVSFEPMLPLAFWNDVQRGLREALKSSPPPMPRRGWVALAVAVAMLVLLVRHVSSQPAALVNGLQDWLIR